MRLRRQFADNYLPRGKSGGRFSLNSPTDLRDRERKKITEMSYRWECVKVLDPCKRFFGHYAVYGHWRLPPTRAINDRGDHVLETELGYAYEVAFVVERGTWFTRAEWEATLDPDEYEIPIGLVGLTPSAAQDRQFGD